MRELLGTLVGFVVGGVFVIAFAPSPDDNAPIRSAEVVEVRIDRPVITPVPFNVTTPCDHEAEIEILLDKLSELTGARERLDHIPDPTTGLTVEEEATIVAILDTTAPKSFQTPDERQARAESVRAQILAMPYGQAILMTCRVLAEKHPADELYTWDRFKRDHPTMARLIKAAGLGE